MSVAFSGEISTVVMTGGTTGWGRVVAKRLLQTPNTRLILGGRRDGPFGSETLGLNETRLESVRSFASDVGELIDIDGIDALVLNANVRLPHAHARTVDGFEATFAANHLSQYLLLRLLLPRLLDGGVIVLTANGTHHPRRHNGVPRPCHADVRLLAHPERDAERDLRTPRAGLQAYCASKLCNLLTARALAADPDIQARQITIVAYDPGLTSEILLGHRPFPWRQVAQTFLPVVHTFMPATNRRGTAIKTLVDFILDRIRPPAGHLYAVLHREQILWPELPTLARRDDLMESLWSESAKLVGLPLK